MSIELAKQWHESGMEAALEKFLRLSTADGDARPRTVAAYRDAIRYYAAWATQAGVDPLTATHDDILAYRGAMIGFYARATVRLRLTAVRLLYRALARWGGRPDNPAEGVKAPKERERAASSVLSRAVAPGTAKALLAAAGEGRDGAMIRLMLMHGLRAGEVSRVNTSDLSVDGSKLTVSGKGGKRRTLILSYRCRLDMAAATGPGWVFQRRGGGSLTVRSIERIVNRALISVGAKEPGKSAHSLRHACAIAAVMGGAKSEAITEMLGHSDPKTTFIYTRAAGQYLENASDAVERALK